MPAADIRLTAAQGLPFNLSMVLFVGVWLLVLNGLPQVEKPCES
jgi:hypothetical protein